MLVSVETIERLEGPEVMKREIEIVGELLDPVVKTVRASGEGVVNVGTTGCGMVRCSEHESRFANAVCVFGVSAGDEFEVERIAIQRRGCR